MSEVLVPLSLTPVLTEAKIAVARQQSRVYRGGIILLHVLPVGAFDHEAVTPAEATARAYLDAVASELRAEGVAVRPVVRAGSPAAVILDECREHECGLVVIGSTSRARLPRALLGSVADEVVRRADCPVLLVRPTGEIDSERRLLSLAPVDLLKPHPLGQRDVDLVRIVGSATRARELGPDFRPHPGTSADEQRFQSVLAAMIRGEELPPVELYKLGFGYYVRDGHHRVAAARQLGRADVAATVIELLPIDDAELHAAMIARQQFERESGLTSIGATRAETYGILARSIDAFRQEHQLEDDLTASSRWYAEVFRPLRRRIRQEGLLARFPGERAADVVARELSSNDT